MSSPKFMKAITRPKYGPPEVLEVLEVPIPAPKKNEILVRVRATTVNRTDCGILTGKPYIIRAFTGLWKPLHSIPGTDFAGEVVSTGCDVSQFSPGQRVWGFYDNGMASQAEYMVVAQEAPIAPIPDGIGFEEAAASGEGAHYAINFIKYLKKKEGMQVLVHGGTGAIGSAAIQLLNYYGARVDAVCDGEHLQKVKALGAIEVIDYLKEDFCQRGKKYDFVMDAVGKSSFGKCKAVLRAGGVYMSSELGPGAENLYLPFTSRFGKWRHVFPIPTDCKSSVKLITKLLGEGVFRPLMDRHYAMEQVKDAYRYVASGQKTGNVTILYGQGMEACKC